jgi:hypothetical protein
LLELRFLLLVEQHHQTWSLSQLTYELAYWQVPLDWQTSWLAPRYILDQEQIAYQHQMRLWISSLPLKHPYFS